MKPLLHTIFKNISEIVTKENFETYVVGGYVRDLMLDRKSTDVDIVVVGDGIVLAKKLAEIWKVKLSIFQNFGTAMLQYDDWKIEFVGSRKESYRQDSRKPIVCSGSLRDDQRRRDFTINTLALSLQKNNFGVLLDPFNGSEDLRKKIIRTPLNPDLTFSDDPLRMLRAIRFACQLGFSIEENTFAAIAKNSRRILIVSKERISQELNKIILSDNPSMGFILLDKSKLLEIIFPELYELKKTEVINNISHKNIFFHSLQVLENISKKTNKLWLRWSALLHDIGKPSTKKFDGKHGWTFHSHNYVGAKMVKQIFRQLKLPLNENMKFVQKLVQLHMRPISLVEKVTDSAIRRLLYEAGDDIDALMTLCEADITSQNREKVKRYLKNFKHVRKRLAEVEENDSIRNFQPPINGEMIMQTFGLKSGKTIGDIKTAIKEAILDGIIPNEYNAAYDFMLAKGKELGLNAKIER